MKPLLAMVMLLAAGATAAPVGTELTWQGTLSHDGVLVEGTWDLRFALYGVAVGGAPEVGPVVVEDVVVSRGRAVVAVDFGAVYSSAHAWIEVAGRPGGSGGAFTVLGPRRLVGETAYARRAAIAAEAATAATATSAADADTLDGEHAAFYLSWSNLTGVPADLADGDDDTFGDLADVVCIEGQLAKFDGSDWVCSADVTGDSFARTVVVGPVGDAAANGAELLAAVAALPTPTSADGGWLVRVEPGLYDLGTASLRMKPWTALAGAGRDVTVITSAPCYPETGPPVGTVTSAESVELRDLTVINTCSPAVPGQWAAAVVNFQPSAVFRRLRVFAPAASEYAHGLTTTGANVVIDQVVAAGGSDTVEFGCGIETAGSNVVVLDATSVGTHSGLRVSGKDTRVLRGSFQATGTGLPGFDTIGIMVESATVQIVDVSAEGPHAAVSASSYLAPATVTLSRVVADGAVVGRANPGTPLALVIEHSRLDSGVATVDVDSNVTAGIALTQLAGRPVSAGGGIVACAGVWDESWTFFPNTCP